MKQFKDNTGTTWTLSLSLQRVRVLREKLGLDLLNPQHYLEVISSLTEQMAFCFLLCEEQAREREITVDDFEALLYGDGVATEASIAFIKETELFFQKLGQKAMVKIAARAVEMRRNAIEKVSQMVATGRFDSMLDQASKEMEAMLQQNAGPS